MTLKSTPRRGRSGRWWTIRTVSAARTYRGSGRRRPTWRSRTHWPRPWPGSSCVRVLADCLRVRNCVREPWSGIHTSSRRSDSSVKFSQTDLEMVTPVQTVQSPGSVRTVFSQFSSVSSGRVCVRRRPLRVGHLGGSVSTVQSASVTLHFSQSSVCLNLNDPAVSAVRIQSVQSSTWEKSNIPIVQTVQS